jgi:electron transfer flavoprotein alpha subunit
MSQENKGVWVFADLPTLAFELLGKGRTLADQLSTELTVVSIGVNSDGDEYVQHGADRVILINDPALTHFQVESYTDTLTALVNEHKPDVLLIGATRHGLELAARLAERLKTGCVTETTRLELDDEKKFVLMDRITFGGNLVETHVSRSKPQIATIAKGLFSAIPADPSKNGEIVKVQPKIEPSRTRILEVKPKTAKGVKLADASIIVSFGRGVRKKEDLVVIEQFAQTVGGAVGCSRPIAEDLHWLPEEQYIGLSGQKVNPKVYFACGISGQIQHLTGIRGSKIIVAINNDPKAPIFEFSDYCVVADLYQMVPALSNAVKELSKSQ